MTSNRRAAALLGVTITLLAAPLTGCISAGPSFDSYQEAKGSDGVVLAAPDAPSLDNDPDHPLRIKTLSPSDPQSGVPTGENDLYFLLFDSETDEPVIDAQISMDVSKSHEDLESSHTQTPTHSGNGVYHGVATFDKPEGWIVDLTITLSDGTTLAFPLHYHAGETDHEHGDYFHTENHEHGDGHEDEH
jgi:hypothetical protein